MRTLRAVRPPAPAPATRASQVFSVIFRKMGRYAHPRLNAALKQLDAMRAQDDFHYRVAAERAMGRALRAIGVCSSRQRGRGVGAWAGARGGQGLRTAF